MIALHTCYNIMILAALRRKYLEKRIISNNHTGNNIDTSNVAASLIISYLDRYVSVRTGAGLGARRPCALNNAHCAPCIARLSAAAGLAVGAARKPYLKVLTRGSQ